MILSGWRAAKAEHPEQHNLRVNTAALIVSNMLTGVLGLVFWGAAARLYPTHAVGLAAAVLTSAIMLSTLSILSLDTLYERFLPLAGLRTGPLVLRGFLLVAGTALVAGVGLVVLGPRDALFESGWQMACYPMLVVVLAMFSLLDKATAGLGVARWAGAKNTFHAVVKLVVILALAWTGSAMAIVLAWGGTAAATAAFILQAMRRRYRSHAQFLGPPNLPPNRELWSYFGSSFGLTAMWLIGPLVVPLIVLTKFGADANAHFAVTWAIVNAFYSTVHFVISPYVAEVAANPDKVAVLSKRMVQTMAVVNLVGSVGLLAVGPFVLGLVGGAYRQEGQGLLYLAALFVPLSAVAAVYEGFARVRRKLGLAIAVRCLSTVVIVCGSLTITDSSGVTGVGWAYLAAEATSAALLFVPTVRWLGRVARESGANPGIPAVVDLESPIT